MGMQSGKTGLCAAMAPSLVDCTAAETRSAGLPAKGSNGACRLPSGTASFTITTATVCGNPFRSTRFQKIQCFSDFSFAATALARDVQLRVGLSIPNSRHQHVSTGPNPRLHSPPNHVNKNRGRTIGTIRSTLADLQLPRKTTCSIA